MGFFLRMMMMVMKFRSFPLTTKVQRFDLHIKLKVVPCQKIDLPVSKYSLTNWLTGIFNNLLIAELSQQERAMFVSHSSSRCHHQRIKKVKDSCTLVRAIRLYCIALSSEFQLGSITRTRCQVSGGFRGARGAPPRAPKFFRFHAVFGEFWQNRMLAPPPGKSWIRRW